jgi:hypothetical protein
MMMMGRKRWQKEGRRSETVLPALPLRAAGGVKITVAVEAMASSIFLLLSREKRGGAGMSLAGGAGGAGGDRGKEERRKSTAGGGGWWDFDFSACASGRWGQHTGHNASHRYIL